MYNIAKKIIEVYLNEQKIPTIQDLGLENSKDLETKHLSFVTLYKNGKIIASSGRINTKKQNTILELIENTLFCIKDPRFGENVKNPLEVKGLNFRVDIIKDDQRKIVKDIKDIDINKNGLIILSQNLGKAGVILPGITNLTSTPEELFNLVCMKAGLDKKTLKEDDYVLYSIESDKYSDF